MASHFPAFGLLETTSRSSGVAVSGHQSPPTYFARANKLRAVLFKLAYLRKLLGPEWRVVFCFVDKDAASFLAGKTWAARAAEALGVEILVQALPDHVRDLGVAAQASQKMIIAPGE